MLITLSESIKTMNSHEAVPTPLVPSGFSQQARRNAGASSQPTREGHRPRNHLLSALPADVWARLSPHVGQTLLIQGQILVESGKPIERVYFPNNGLLSLMLNTRSGMYVETGLIGWEGLTNAFELMDGVPALSRTMVQISGTACWLPVEVLRAEFRWAGYFQRRLLRFLHWQEIQSAQCALCNRLHAVEERLARWLLTVHDRVESNELFLTHAAISHLLGTRRSGVTVALNNLENAGAIRCTRGRIVIVDTDKLRDCSCECYDSLSAHSALLLT